MLCVVDNSNFFPNVDNLCGTNVSIAPIPFVHNDDIVYPNVEESHFHSCDDIADMCVDPPTFFPLICPKSKIFYLHRTMRVKNVVWISTC